MDELREPDRDFSVEVTLIHAGNDPLLYSERRDYLNAIQDALAGIEAARRALRRARQRDEGMP